MRYCHTASIDQMMVSKIPSDHGLWADGDNDSNRDPFDAVDNMTTNFPLLGAVDDDKDGEPVPLCDADEFLEDLAPFHQEEEYEGGKRQRIIPTAHIVDPLTSEDESSSTGGRSTPPASPYTEEDDDIDTLPINSVPITDGPIPHPSWSLTESLIAQKMSKLSMKEREDVYYDIHGVQDAIDEDAEEGFADRKLKEMETEILKRSSSERNAYNLARSNSPSFVDDRDFRLRFLRADRFDPKLAALRYVRHYQTKLELFGKEKLGRHIVQDDLGSEALDNLYSGMNQILPRRDNAGRLVWIWIAAPHEQSYSREALLRRIFYNNMLISEDVDTQKKGSVGIIYTLNQQQTKRGTEGRKRVENYSGITRSLPMPIACIHFVYDNYMWLPVLSVAQMSVHLFVRLRVRAHYGSHSDCMYKLQTFGIPADTIPVDETGKYSGLNHKNFLENRRSQEREWAKNKATGASSAAADAQRSQTTAPSSSDVLLGRGSGYFNHVGNVRYRAMIEDLKDKYDRSSNEGKQKTTEDVVKTIRDLGGRFLKNNKGVWVQVDDKVARQKVGHSFRALRSSAAKPKQEAGKPKTRDGLQGGDSAPVVAMKRARGSDIISF
mmetsp:Transcript_12151/g.19181  ORF Transcript_12151/g.19181 Transcript_12151/m.19181 type:complete len:606 (-) Transcript_12151:24-1841(-)